MVRGGFSDVVWLFIRDFYCILSVNSLNYESFLNFESPFPKDFIFAEQKAPQKMENSRIFFAEESWMVMKKAPPCVRSFPQ